MASSHTPQKRKLLVTIPSTGIWPRIQALISKVRRWLSTESKEEITPGYYRSPSYNRITARYEARQHIERIKDRIRRQM